ncbi:protein kinase [Methylobacterium sp. CB376]|uniref:serine/threonine-protein kinase n=1 Tax=Methylobacterium sp. CB376 TaxID=3138063 RepID=UPI0024B160FB|nr:serine/threonine-protein kinase [Methylobacterium nodulans]WFT81179.1 protein kinase [Methylobacterium nodulans]
MSEETVFLPPQSRSFIAPGTRLNDIYVIRSLIAAGGMGEVYRGEALATGDAVAIKVIKPDLARNASALALFRREASALHNLHHEAIVRYFVFSIDPKLELPYLAMEFVDGVSLSDRLKEGPLDGPTLRLLLRRLAAGLQAAHELGIIHRDVSPDNVILPGGNVARAKLIDFGIARAPSTDGTVIGGGFAGKYAYVSPEQLGLYGGEVTPQSDIYSLGLLMAHAARGRALDMGSNHVDVVEKRRRVPDLTGIEEPIRGLLQAMLQPNPKDRPADLAAVAALAAAEPAAPRRLPVAVLAAAGGGVAATAALAALAFAVLPARRAEAPLTTPVPQVVGPAEPVVTPSVPAPPTEPSSRADPSSRAEPARPPSATKPPIIALPDPGEDPDAPPASPRDPRREPPPLPAPGRDHDRRGGGELHPQVRRGRLLLHHAGDDPAARHHGRRLRALDAALPGFRPGVQERARDRVADHPAAGERGAVPRRRLPGAPLPAARRARGEHHHHAGPAPQRAGPRRHGRDPRRPRGRPAPRGG